MREPHRNLRWLYLLGSRMIAGLFLGFELWLLYLAMQMLSPDLQALVHNTPLIQ